MVLATGGMADRAREAFGADAAWLFAWSRFAVIFSASGALLDSIQPAASMRASSR